LGIELESALACRSCASQKAGGIGLHSITQYELFKSFFLLLDKARMGLDEMEY
jgi:hypothetical protein